MGYWCYLREGLPDDSDSDPNLLVGETAMAGAISAGGNMAIAYGCFNQDDHFSDTLLLLIFFIQFWVIS